MHYMVGFGAGYFVTSLIFYSGHVISQGRNAETFFNPVLFVSALGGLVFMTGSLFYCTAIDKIGLSRSNQWKSLSGPLSSTLILFFFAEYKTTNYAYIIIATGTIFISAVLFSIREDTGNAVDRKGIIYAVITAAFFGFNGIVMKYVSNRGLFYPHFVGHSFILLSTALGYILIREGSLKALREISAKDNILAFSGGVLQFFASYTGIKSFSFITGSIAATLLQFTAVWTVLTGIFIFKEVNFAKNKLRIIAGFIFTIAGAVLLLLA